MNTYIKRILYISSILVWIGICILFWIKIEHNYDHNFHNATCNLLNYKLTILEPNKFILVINITQIYSSIDNITVSMILQFEQYTDVINFIASFPRLCYYNNHKIYFSIPSYNNIYNFIALFLVLIVPLIFVGLALILECQESYQQQYDEIRQLNELHSI